MSLPRPTKPTDKIAFSVHDIRRIIKACGESRVSEFRLGDLTIRFDTKVSGESQAPEAKTETVLSPTDTAISAIQNNVAIEAFERDEVSVREEQLAQMFIEDPAQAEKLLIDGHLDLEPDEPTEGT